jgi:hypothetical protein
VTVCFVVVASLMLAPDAATKGAPRPVPKDGDAWEVDL